MTRAPRELRQPPDEFVDGALVRREAAENFAAKGLTNPLQVKDHTMSIIGDDDRRPIDDISMSPWSGICRVEAWFGNEPLYGTAFLIAASWALTAAHVIWQGGAPDALTVVMRGFTASAKCLPYKPYLAGAVPHNDVGLIRLNDAAPSEAYVFPRLAATDQWLLKAKEVKVPLNVAGFPTKPPHEGKLVCHAAAVHDFDAGVIEHAVDTVKGQSGGPLFLNAPSARFAIGVHGHGDVSDVAGSGVHNKAARLRPHLMAWIDATIEHNS